MSRTSLRSPWRHALTLVFAGFLVVAVAVVASAPQDPASVGIGLVLGGLALVLAHRSLVSGCHLEESGLRHRQVTSSEVVPWAEVAFVEHDVRTHLGVLYRVSVPVVHLVDGSRLELEGLARPTGRGGPSPATCREVAALDEALRAYRSGAGRAAD